MIYSYKCECGEQRSVSRSMAEGPPKSLECSCGEAMIRDWLSDLPMVDTSNCRDHNFIPPQHRTISSHDRGTPTQIENQFRSHIKNRRDQLKDGNRGSIKHTMSVPAHLYHGKIKETGDKNYWNDTKNLSRHKDCKVG